MFRDSCSIALAAAILFLANLPAEPSLFEKRTASRVE